MSIEAVLQAQEQDVARDTEVQRILACHAGDYYAILEINPLQADPEQLPSVLRKAYRKKSLLIHPDKTRNVQAPQAFDRLKTAERVLGAEELEQAEKAALDTIYKEVQTRLEEAEPGVASGARGLLRIREKVALALEHHQKEQQVEQAYMQRQEARKQTDLQTAAQERELKKSWDTRWAGDRDVRVQLWRDYSSRVGKKTRKKKRVLI